MSKHENRDKLLSDHIEGSTALLIELLDAIENTTRKLDMLELTSQARTIIYGIGNRTYRHFEADEKKQNAPPQHHRSYHSYGQTHYPDHGNARGNEGR